MKTGDWVLFPQTKDDINNPNIVAKVIRIDNNIVNVSINGEILPIPLKWCKVVNVFIN